MQLTTLPSSIHPYLLTLAAFLLPTLLWIVVKPFLIHLSKSRREHDELIRLKRDPDLFRALLMQQPQMPPIPDDLHPIMLGNPKAEHTITMVTNPYCRPCAKTHKELEQLLKRNNNVKAAIIFAGDGTNGRATQVAKYIMALAEQGNPIQALTDWYEQPEKNFDAWAKKYPTVADLSEWIPAANRHRDWCWMADINATPAMFVDEYKLLELHSIISLQWLINHLPIAVSTKDLAKS